MRCSKCNVYIKVKIHCNCKCGGVYCNECIPFFKHSCPYDYRKDKYNDLTQRLVKVSAIKVSQI